MIYDIISVLILAILTLILTGTVIRIFAKGRAHRLAFLRTFKKGKCAIIYLVAIPLHWMGFLSAGVPALPALFDSIGKAIALVVLRFDTESLLPLLYERPLFAAATYYCYILVVINAIILYLSFFQQWATHLCYRISWHLTKRDRLMIIGHEEKCLQIYASDTAHCKRIVDTLSPQDASALFLKGIAYLDTKDPLEEIERFLKRKARTFPRITAVIHTDDDSRNLLLCRRIVTMIDDATERMSEEKKRRYLTAIFESIDIYVIGNPDYETLYESVAEASHGCIRYANKYKLIALDFIDRYPLSRFIPRERIAPDTTILPKTKLHMILIGFGKTNRQILLSSVKSNQFLTRDEKGSPILLPVSYHIFDAGAHEHDQNLNHTLFRFQNEILPTANTADYLPLPPLPAEISFPHCGTEDAAFYDTLAPLCRDKNSTVVAVIALGNDLSNLDTAEKLSQKKREWDAAGLHIFCKAKSGQQALVQPATRGFTIIGDEDELIFAIKSLTNDRITTMAKACNRIYAMESAKPGDDLDAVARDADYRWHTALSQLERDSNIHATLGIRTKLHLLGLDYQAGKSEVDLFTERYTGGLPIGDAPNEYLDTPRGLLALQEHYRWNAYMLASGIVPATLREILTDRRADGRYSNGKSYPCRRHGNITTAEGLKTVRRLIAERDGVSEASVDVIHYDYHLADSAPDLLARQGLAITERT